MTFLIILIFSLSFLKCILSYFRVYMKCHFGDFFPASSFQQIEKNLLCFVLGQQSLQKASLITSLLFPGGSQWHRCTVFRTTIVPVFSSPVNCTILLLQYPPTGLRVKTDNRLIERNTRKQVTKIILEIEDARKHYLTHDTKPDDLSSILESIR